MFQVRAPYATVPDELQSTPSIFLPKLLPNTMLRGRQSRQNGGREKPARYFGGQVRMENQAQLQLWRGGKRRDHALAWNLAVGPRQTSAEDTILSSVGTTRHEARRTSADFLPVDPVVVSLDGNAQRQDEPITEGDEACTESVEQWVARKTKEFNLKTRERPNSDEIWLEFADFQAEAVRALHGE